jgi:hypothetical protein
MSRYFFQMQGKVPIMELMEFSEWMIAKYDEWRKGKVGHAASIASFSKQFGASYQLVLDWMKPNGKKPSHKKYVDAIIAIYGEEAYEVLGISQPGPISIDWDRRLRDAVVEATGTLNTKRLDPASEEGLRIIAEVAAKYGLKTNKTPDE